MVRLTKLHEHDSDAQWITPKDMTDSDWPVRFIVRLMFMEDWCEEWAKKNGKYHIEVHAVSPEAAKDGLESCIRSCGQTREEWDKLPREAQCSMMVEYGLSACLFQQSGNNRITLFKAARRELELLHSFTFGFSMDRTLNGIGATGWDFIRGDPALRNPLVEDE